MSSRRRIFRQLKTWKKYDRRYRARGVHADTPGYDNAYLRAAVANTAKAAGRKHPSSYGQDRVRMRYIAKAARWLHGGIRRGWSSRR